MGIILYKSCLLCFVYLILTTILGGVIIPCFTSGKTALQISDDLSKVTGKSFSPNTLPFLNCQVTIHYILKCPVVCQVHSLALQGKMVAPGSIPSRLSSVSRSRNWRGVRRAISTMVPLGGSEGHPTRVCHYGHVALSGQSWKEKSSKQGYSFRLRKDSICMCMPACVCVCVHVCLQGRGTEKWVETVSALCAVSHTASG